MLRRPFVLRRAGLALLFGYALAAHAAPEAPSDASYPNTSGFGVDFHSGEDWHRECMRVAHLAPKRPARPRAQAQRCDATDLYYRKRDQAATAAAEWRQVRDCAEASGDDAVLMMLYANGHGVARDADRAVHHACRLDSAKAEMEGRVAYLASGAAAHDGQAFDLCDHITSGRMGGVCAAIHEAREGRVRSARLERFAATLTATARQPYASLRKAAEAFARQSEAEVDRSGTGAAGFAIRHVARRENEFLETLLKAEQGKIPHASAAQLAQLDRQLNAEYRRLLARASEQDGHPERIRYSTVTRDAVRRTERAWLAYRDAWKPFLAAARLPADAVSVQALLTRQRIAQLKRL